MNVRDEAFDRELRALAARFGDGGLTAPLLICELGKLIAAQSAPVAGVSDSSATPVSPWDWAVQRRPLCIYLPRELNSVIRLHRGTEWLVGVSEDPNRMMMIPG